MDGISGIINRIEGLGTSLGNGLFSFLPAPILALVTAVLGFILVYFLFKFLRGLIDMFF